MQASRLEYSTNHVPDIDSFLSLVKRRRSVRAGFIEEKEVPDEYVEKILDAAHWAPSAGNAQPWEFIVVRKASTRHEIADLYKLQLQDKVEIEKTARGKINWAKGAIPGLDFKNAPVHIIVLGDPRLVKAYPVRTRLDKWESHFYSSLSAAVLQLMLAAESLGLSCMYISDVASPFFSVKLKALLNIPEALVVYHLIPLGFANKSPTIDHPRRQLDEMIHYESYDNSKFRDDKMLDQFISELSIRGTKYKW